MSEGGFHVAYADGAAVYGDFFNDSVAINGKIVENQRLGLAHISNSSTVSGIMGLSFSYGDNLHSQHPTFIDNMVQQGLIDAPVFSLFTIRNPAPRHTIPDQHAKQDSLDAESGTILFGGIDSKKYHGKLTALPLIIHPHKPFYEVHLRGFEVDDVDLDALDTVAVIDSGSTSTYLPSSQVRKVYRHFDVRYHSEVGIAFVDCA